MQQFDLFAGGGITPPSAAPRMAARDQPPPALPDAALPDATLADAAVPAATLTDATLADAAVPAATLTDAALAAAIPGASQSACHELARLAVSRRLRAAVPALEVLCRRFRGFGQEHPVQEQMVALWAMAELGGSEARAAVQRLLGEDVIAGPGQPAAVRAAAALRCILPEQVSARLLRHPEPGVRADACRCAPRTPAVDAVLLSLLQDLHPEVAQAAAIALGRRGVAEARPFLLGQLLQAPTPEVLDALAGVADEEATIRIGRLAAQDSPLRDAALAALEVIETPRAIALLARFGGPNEATAAR